MADTSGAAAEAPDKSAAAEPALALVDKSGALELVLEEHTEQEQGLVARKEPVSADKSAERGQEPVERKEPVSVGKFVGPVLAPEGHRAPVSVDTSEELELVLEERMVLASAGRFEVEAAASCSCHHQFRIGRRHRRLRFHRQRLLVAEEVDRH